MELYGTKENLLEGSIHCWFWSFNFFLGIVHSKKYMEHQETFPSIFSIHGTVYFYKLFFIEPQNVLQVIFWYFIKLFYVKAVVLVKED